MPPRVAAKKDFATILFDLYAENGEKLLQTLLKISSNAFFSNSKDITSLILLGAEETNNHKNTRHGGFDHIKECDEEPLVYKPQDQLRTIQENKDNRAPANWLEGLLVASSLLVQASEDMGGLITAQLVFLTDLTGAVPDLDEDTIQEIVVNLNNIGAYLYVIGPDVAPPSTITNPMDIKLWMDEIKLGELHPRTNLGIMGQIIDGLTNRVICTCEMGVNLFYSYRNSGGGQPWRVPLQIGQEISIPEQTLKVINDQMVVMLKVHGERNVKTIWVDAEDESKEIPYEDIVSGISRHGKFVQLSDEKRFRVTGPRGFHVVCFTPSSNVPEYLMGGESTYMVLPLDSASKPLFDLLIERLAEKNLYVIARRNYANNFCEKLVVLVPKIDIEPKCFYLTHLPYADQMGVDYRERDVSRAPPTEGVETVVDYLGALAAKQVTVGVPMMYDLNYAKLISKAADKFTGKKLNLNALDFDFSKMFDEVQNGGAAGLLKEAWPEREDRGPKKDEVGTKGDGSDYEDEFDW